MINSPQLLFAQKEAININVDHTPLNELIVELESNYDFLISYKEEAIQEVIILGPIPPSDIHTFLKLALENTNLTFEVLNDKYILIKDNKPSSSSDISNTNPIPKLSLCGQVLDEMTVDGLAYVNIYCPRTMTGSLTDEDGSFQFSTSVQKSDTIVISYVGYDSQKFLASDFTQKPCKVVRLSLRDYGDDFVVITEYLTDGISLDKNAGKTVLEPAKIGALPGQAEPDVLQAIQFLPGISSPESAPGSLCIRGGTPDQNLIQWEEIPIYHTAHHFGMISALNPFIIDKAAVYCGGFSADYGGKVAGVIDFKSADPGLFQADYGVGINFLGADAFAKIPLLKNKAAIIVSARRSISDMLKTPTFRSITKRIHQGVVLQIPTNNRIPKDIDIDDHFGFIDHNFKFTYQFSPKDKVNASYLFAKNDFESKVFEEMKMQEQFDTLLLYNLGASINWQRNWTANFSTNLSGIISNYEYKYDYAVRSPGDNNDIVGVKKSRIYEQQVHLSGQYTFKQNHLLKSGYHLINYDLDYLISKNKRGSQRQNEKSELKSNLHALYTTFATNENHQLGVEIGARLSYFEKEKDFYLDPRFKFWYKPIDPLSFYVNAGRYHQFLSQLAQIEGDRSSIDIPVWVFTGQKGVPVLEADHFQAGVIFDKKSWLLDIQFYYRLMNGLTSLSSGFDENLSNDYQLGKGKSRGVDILLKKRWRNYRSWLSYSYSKIDYSFPQFFDRNFAPENDQPHILQWVNLWKFDKLNFSIGWKISSGVPYSQKEYFEVKTNSMNGMEPSSEFIEPIISEFNSERLPFQHQLSASITYTLKPKRKKWNGHIGLSVFNIYDEKNIYSRSFFIDNQPNSAPDLIYNDNVDLGITPNLSLRMFW